MAGIARVEEASAAGHVAGAVGRLTGAYPAAVPSGRTVWGSTRVSSYIVEGLDLVSAVDHDLSALDEEE